MKEQEILQLKEEFQKSDLTRKGQILEYVAQDNDFFKMNEPWEQIEKNINFPRLQPSKYIEEVLAPPLYEKMGNMGYTEKEANDIISEARNIDMYKNDIEEINLLKKKIADLEKQESEGKLDNNGKNKILYLTSDRIALEKELSKKRYEQSYSLLKDIDNDFGNEWDNCRMDAIKRLAIIKDFELKPYILDTNLIKAAKFRTIESYMMGGLGYHKGYIRSISDTVNKHNLSSVGLGENLHPGVSGKLSSKVVEGWIVDIGQTRDSNGKRTAGHRENFLHKIVGYVGYYNTENLPTEAVMLIHVAQYKPTEIPFYINIGTSPKPKEDVKESPLKKEEPIIVKTEPISSKKAEPKIIVPLDSVISTPPKQEEKVVSEAPKPKEMFVDNTKPLVPEQTSKKEEVEEVEEEQIETTNIEMDRYPLNYLESNFELALEKKYKTDYSPNDVFRFFEENKFLDNQNIFDNMGFFYDTDLTMFVEESNINMGLLQALSFIDVTLPPLEVIQNINRLDSLRGKVDTDTLYNYLVNNQQRIKTYPAFSKKNKEKLNLSTYNEAVRKLNSFGLEDPKYTFKKEYDVEGFLGEELLTSINDSAERQKQELLKLKQSNETSIVSNTNESTKIQNLKQQEVKQSQTAVGESAPTKESDVASINTEAIKVGGSENLGSEPVNKNIAQSLGVGTILSGATEKMGVGTILSGAKEALESPNDFGKGLIDTLKREGVEKLGQNNIATALSGVFGSKDIGSDLISGLLNNKGGLEVPSPSTYLENNSINKTLVSELGKNVGINQIIENSDVIKGQTDVLNSVESKMNEISVLKSSIEELKSKVQTLDPTNMVGRAKENISSLVGSTVDDGSNNKVMSEEIKFNQGTPKGLESNKAVEDEIEDVVLDMESLPNLPSFTPIGQKR